jgi:hypothetical protein
MGPYLSEPVTEKKTAEGKGSGFTFCVSEMQGKLNIIKDGEKAWKTQTSAKLIWATAIPYLLSLMDMVV